MLLNYSLQNKASKIDGKGAFALEDIPARKKIGNLGGEIISLREARKRAAQTQRVAMVEFGDGRALDATVHPNELRYVNHSCQPNTYMRVCYSRVEFYSLEFIKKGKDLTGNYEETQHDGKLKCNAEPLIVKVIYRSVPLCVAEFIKRNCYCFISPFINIQLFNLSIHSYFVVALCKPETCPSF